MNLLYSRPEMSSYWGWWCSIYAKHLLFQNVDSVLQKRGWMEREQLTIHNNRSLMTIQAAFNGSYFIHFSLRCVIHLRTSHFLSLMRNNIAQYQSPNVIFSASNSSQNKSVFSVHSFSVCYQKPHALIPVLKN